MSTFTYTSEQCWKRVDVLCRSFIGYLPLCKTWYATHVRLHAVYLVLNRIQFWCRIDMSHFNVENEQYLRQTIYHCRWFLYGDQKDIFLKFRTHSKNLLVVPDVIVSKWTEWCLSIVTRTERAKRGIERKTVKERKRVKERE